LFSRGTGEGCKDVSLKRSNLESMQQLADSFVNDAEFWKQKKDPKGATEGSGLQLDEEDRQALRSIDWSGSDEELKQRVSKGSSSTRSRRPHRQQDDREVIPSTMRITSVPSGRILRTLTEPARST
jgi:hypothetical protein